MPHLLIIGHVICHVINLYKVLNCKYSQRSYNGRVITGWTEFSNFLWKEPRSNININMSCLSKYCPLNDDWLNYLHYSDCSMFQRMIVSLSLENLRSSSTSGMVQVLQLLPINRRLRFLLSSYDFQVVYSVLPHSDLCVERFRCLLLLCNHQ